MKTVLLPCCLFLATISVSALEILSMEQLNQGGDVFRISSDGNTAFGLTTNGNLASWRDGILEEVEALKGEITYPMDMSGDGKVAVGTYMDKENEGQERGFIWKDGVLSFFQELESQGRVMPRAVSEDGSVIVGLAWSVGKAFRYENGSTSFLPSINPESAEEALDITPDGQIVVGRSGVMATKWEGNSVSDLWERVAQAISADGSTLAGIGPITRDRELVIWKKGELTIIEPPANWTFDPVRINRNGSVIVGFAFDPSWDSYAAIWVKEDGYKLHLLKDLLDQSTIGRQGFVPWFAGGVSADGTAIVVNGGKEDSSERLAYIVRLSPPPAWGPFPLENGFADTDSWLGELWPENHPWIWSANLDYWMYVPDSTRDAGEGWVYFPRE